MREPCTIIVGSAERLDQLRTHVNAPGEIVAFTDRQFEEAVEALNTRKPALVVIERLLAATSRGAALIQRVRTDPALAGTEVRVIAHDGSYSRVSRRAIADASRPAEALPAQGTAASTPAAVAPSGAPERATVSDKPDARRAPRRKMAEGTEAQIDGAAGIIVDLSILGAQIVAASTLRPQQRLRITLADETGAARFSGVVIWASFELTKAGPRYRAGVEFTDAQAAAVEGFSSRHQAG